jgi:uncharacterized protein (DUF1778 family)
MATPVLSLKTKRIDLRVSEEIKALIDRAAQLRGCSVSEFIISTASAAAEETVAKREILYLSMRDSARFYAALDNPPEPSEKMREIAQKHAETVEVIW